LLIGTPYRKCHLSRMVASTHHEPKPWQSLRSADIGKDDRGAAESTTKRKFRWADAAINGLANKAFLILTHPTVASYVLNKVCGRSG
jgi:hypothetical protein